MGELRAHFDGHPSVDTIGRVIERAEHIAGVAHVVDHQVKYSLFRGRASGGVFGDRGGVVGPAANCLLKDGGIGGDTHHVVSVNQLLQVAGVNPLPR